MTFVLGIDPGAHGAFAVYDTTDGRIVDMRDMPTWWQVVGNKKRLRIDALAVAEFFEEYQMMGVELVVMEAVGGRPAQGAMAAYVFGYGVGMVYMAALFSKIVLETVPPSNWKRALNVQGKGKADDSAIIQRANELFPHDRDLFKPESKRATKIRVDRVEAAMIAKFGGDHLLTRMGTTKEAHERAEV